MSNVINLTQAEFEQEVLESDVPVLVDYWAPWCGPCRVVGPVVERIADEHVGSLKVAKVNVDEEPGLASAAGVHGIPFLAVYRNGEPVAHVVGAHPKHTIEHALKLGASADHTA